MKTAWLSPSELFREMSLPAELTFEALARGELDAVIEQLRKWYPDVHVGAESRHLERSFYERDFALKGESLDRPLLGVVCRAKGSHELVAFMSLEKNDRSRVISSPLAVIEPTQRGMGLGRLGPAMLEHAGRAMEAELAVCQMTLKTIAQQRNAERQGFVLCGVLPAIDRDAISPGIVRRVHEALYVKILVPQSEVQRPAGSNLTESVRTLWRAIFGSEVEATPTT